MDCVKVAFEKMGAQQSCEDMVDVVRLRQRDDGPNIKPIIVEFIRVF